MVRNVDLNVVAISVDSATANRKFFVEHLCGGLLRSSFQDPFASQPIFLIFDPVHDIKDNFMSTTFLDNINRGGLYRPSEYCYVTIVSCWRIYEGIRSSAVLKDKLLGVGNQRKLFVKVLERATENGQLLVDDNLCMKGHDLKEQISIRLFNCVAKNLSKELTAAANRPSERSAKMRKIAKLTSKLKSD
jgi:hypothetical protein